MKDTVKSEVTNRSYYPVDSVRILNTKQAMMYIKHGCTLYDLYESDGTLVFLFNRSESTPYYEKWCNHELN